MTCRQFADFIADYLSGNYRQTCAPDFDHHLQICTNCVKYLADYKAASRSARPRSRMPQPPCRKMCRTTSSKRFSHRGAETVSIPGI